MGPAVVSGRRRFHLPGLGFRVVGDGVERCQGNAARMRCQAAAIAVAHRQLRSIRRWICRAPRVDAGGDVQDPVAERGDLAAGQRRLVCEAEEFAGSPPGPGSATRA